jgi:DNA-binding IclR family transcriptional regulator
MSIEDITGDTVCAAVQAGRDDVYKLAEHFGVPHTSSTLRRMVALLARDGQVTIDPTDGYRIALS